MQNFVAAGLTEVDLDDGSAAVSRLTGLVFLILPMSNPATIATAIAPAPKIKSGLASMNDCSFDDPVDRVEF